MEKDKEQLQPNSNDTTPTGEWGFCEGCGEVRAVVMPAGDRLQNRLRKAFWAMAAKNGQDGLKAAEKEMIDAVRLLDMIGFVGQANPKSVRLAMVKMVGALMVAEGALSEELGEAVDLVREATEEFEDLLDDWGGVEGADGK